MPELPEVEQFAHYVNYTSLHKKIDDITVKTDSLLHNVTVRYFKKTLIGKKFKHARRRGKFMIVDIAGDSHKLVVHFGMTGSMTYSKTSNMSEEDRKYAQVQFIFASDYVLAWVNKRKFGKIYLVTSLDQVPLLQQMGPEPLELSKKDFLNILTEHENKNIKALLMDQRDIAGIGNNYSNEILFQAGIDPAHTVDELSKKERERLYSVMQRVLKRALKLDTVAEKFPSTWLLAHKKDRQCPNDNHRLKQKKIAGRTALYCPKDQK